MPARLDHLSVSELRCLDGLELSFAQMTALIGANGAGKSSTIRALQFLFGNISLDDSDCSDGAIDTDVSVSGTFTGLTGDWVGRLRPWLDDNGDLTITRSRVVSAGGRARETYGSVRRQVPGFGAVRGALDRGEPATQLRALWEVARGHTGGALPAWTSKPAAAAVLAEFEAGNPQLVTERSPDSALAFGSGGEVDLTEMIELLVLPAMRDASSDASDSRGSTLTRLVDLTVRAGMDLDQQLAALSEQTAVAYNRIVEEAGGERLDALSGLITDQLNSFAPGSRVQLRWEPRMPALAPPPVRARIIESDHEADIGRQGHGVQRAYVFSLLRALLEARRGDGGARPGLLLAVEEPEVYQHPIRARYVANVLADLAHATENSTQVVYTTHSPFFVSVEHIESVRQLRLAPVVNGAGEDTNTEPEEQLVLPIAGATSPATAASPAISGAQVGQADGAGSSPFTVRTRATAPTLAGMAGRLDQARAGRGQAWTRERVAAQLPGLLGTGVSEGFFAEKVVLVEGEEDTGYIHGAADAAGVDLYERGVAVIAVGGKDRLLLAHEVFFAAAVPTYVVYDTDIHDGKVPDGGALMINHMLSGLVGETPEEQPATNVGAFSAPMKPSLGATIRSEVGEEIVEEAFTASLASMGLSAQAKKNGHLVRQATKLLYAQGHSSVTLDAVVAAISS